VFISLLPGCGASPMKTSRISFCVATLILAVIHIFPDPGHPEHSGRWKFSKNMIVLNFTDGHDNTIALPLDSKGTPGTDEGGRPATNELVTAH
jgi:hypothetical protein